MCVVHFIQSAVHIPIFKELEVLQRKARFIYTSENYKQKIIKFAVYNCTICVK